MHPIFLVQHDRAGRDVPIDCVGVHGQPTKTNSQTVTKGVGMTLTAGESVGWPRSRRPGLGDLDASSAGLILGLLLVIVAPGIETGAKDRHIHGHVAVHGQASWAVRASSSLTTKTPGKVPWHQAGWAGRVLVLYLGHSGFFLLVRHVAGAET
jgi:hypothetical protein